MDRTVIGGGIVMMCGLLLALFGDEDMQSIGGGLLGLGAAALGVKRVSLRSRGQSNG